MLPLSDVDYRLVRDMLPLSDVDYVSLGARYMLASDIFKT